MRKIIKILTILILGFIVISCNSGYQRKRNHWLWVTYNLGSGKYVKMIDSADYKSFIVIDNQESENDNLYAKDIHRVYFRGQSIKGADPLTFKLMKQYGYSKDKNYVYMDSSRILFADPSTFEVLASPYSRDMKRVFNGTLPMNVDNPIEFRVTKSDSCIVGTRKADFILTNPEYSWLDTINVEWIYTGCFDWSQGETKSEKFAGFKRIK